MKIQSVRAKGNAIILRKLADIKHGKEKQKRFAAKMMETKTRTVVAMLWHGDEPTGEIRAMLLIALFRENLVWRDKFIMETDPDARMYEWRWNKRRSSDGILHRRGKSRQLDYEKNIRINNPKG
jgi:hypothetical protein